MVKCSKKLAPRFAALSRCLCFYASERGSTLVPTSTLSPERPCHVSQMHSKKGNCFSPSNPGDLQTMLSTPRLLPFFPTGPLLCPPGSTRQWKGLLKLRTLNSLLVKTCHSSFPSQCFWGSVCLAQSPGRCLPSISSLSLLSLRSRLSPLCSTRDSFSLESCLCTSDLP